MILAEQRVDLGPAAHEQRHGDVLVGQMHGGLDRRQTLSLAEGDAADRKDIIYLEPLPLFTK